MSSSASLPQPNDWVRTGTAGIWRVDRIIPEHFQTRYSLDDPKELFDGPLVIVKRLVDSRWKRSFEIEAVHHSLLRRLNKADSKKLQTFCSKNAELLELFEDFDRPLLNILNIGFSLDRKSDNKKLKKEILDSISEKLAKGITSEQILKAIASSSFSDACGEIPSSATLQFVNQNIEIRRRQLIFREMKLLDF